MTNANELYDRLKSNDLQVVWLARKLNERGWACTRASLSNLLRGESTGSKSQMMLKDAKLILDFYELAMEKCKVLRPEVKWDGLE